MSQSAYISGAVTVEEADALAHAAYVASSASSTRPRAGSGIRLGVKGRARRARARAQRQLKRRWRYRKGRLKFRIAAEVGCQILFRQCAIEAAAAVRIRASLAPA